MDSRVRWRGFDELTLDELYEILRLRQLVFVVEQRSLYPDIDGFDREALHGLGALEESGRLTAYARILPPGIRFPGPCIGRVIVARRARGRGIGRALVAEAVRHAAATFPAQSLYLAAQSHLEGLYASFGFARISEPYDEDGIPHVDMMAPAPVV